MEIMFSIRGNSVQDAEKTINFLGYCLKKINTINSNITSFYAQSEDLDEAMSHKLIDITGKRYEENLHFVDGSRGDVGAWSGDLDNDASVFLFSKEKQTVVTLNFYSDLKPIELLSKIKEVFINLNNDYELIFFNVNYPNANIVYPDRPSTSWMLFIKDTNFSEAKIDQAEVIENIEKDGVKIGELLITTKNYDPKNIHHQNRSNDIDILLLGYHLLPKYKEIYVK
ncbi:MULTISPECIES: immunity 52 family protein [Providencia]|uniref:immunity 52 family protein n=2 Tax=Morganellaceae TaxID=1903414 RepID=UPI000CE66D15|nr:MULTISPECIES: immunity 52 family protein [Providencia]AVE40890.1 hypothetical protein AM353_03065 [Providencia stuartii]MBN5559139.1 immunity 52 family protein [Providencia stuartii]MBQ0457430.1 immunity 52 family protein [Providencia stuartii]MBQ0695640.1 immunity 52 family protein [Providencia stuartii]MDN7225573.1 immunity 52 family protein [Providencia stuartii]